MAIITIIGGHGKVALLAEPKLVEAGHTVNAVIPAVNPSGHVLRTDVAALLNVTPKECGVVSSGLAGGVGGGGHGFLCSCLVD